MSNERNFSLDCIANQQVKEANAEITATEKKIKKLEEDVEKLQDDAREKENELSEAKVLVCLRDSSDSHPLPRLWSEFRCSLCRNTRKRPRSTKRCTSAIASCKTSLVNTRFHCGVAPSPTCAGHSICLLCCLFPCRQIPRCEESRGVEQAAAAGDHCCAAQTHQQRFVL